MFRVLQWKRYSAYLGEYTRPSTIGKIEAFHKAYGLEAWMFKTHQEFIHYWNYQRPHQGIGYLYPADIHFCDLNRLTDVEG